VVVFEVIDLILNILSKESLRAKDSERDQKEAVLQVRKDFLAFGHHRSR
jgi:hypothetical protein